MKKKNWFWNLVIVVTVVVCIVGFVMHYKNWSKIEEGHFQLMSGIYKQRISLSKINSIAWVKQLPKMERKNGFSWLTKEKGVFKDSITDTKVYVFVDDLRQQKVQLVHSDSLRLYFNFSDSLETQNMYKSIHEVLGRGEK